MTALPSAASSSISAWISALAPTSTPRVGSSRIRIRHSRGQPLGEHELLLVAARQPGGDHVRARGAHPQALEVGSGRAALLAAADEQPKRDSRVSIASVVLLSALIDSTSPCRLRSSGTRPMPWRHRDLRARERAPAGRATADPSGRLAIEAEQRLRDLRSAGADQAGEPEHLAAAQRERDVAEARRARQSFDPQQLLARARPATCCGKYSSSGRPIIICDQRRPVEPPRSAGSRRGGRRAARSPRRTAGRSRPCGALRRCT